MSLFRFVGSQSVIGNVIINQFGQLMDLDDLTAHDAILGRAGVLPDADFQTVGLTEDELIRYADYVSIDIDDQNFMSKRTKLHQMAAAYGQKYAKEVVAGNTFMARSAAAAPSPAPAARTPYRAPAATPETKSEE